MWKTWTGGPAAAPVAGPMAGDGGGAWHPTIVYLVVLVVAEILAVALLTRTVLR